MLGLVFEFFDAARWVVLNPIQIDALFENDRGNRQDVIGGRWLIFEGVTQCN